jgi:hypothetical protein
MGWQGLSVHLVSQERLLADRLCQCQTAFALLLDTVLQAPIESGEDNVGRSVRLTGLREKSTQMSARPDSCAYCLV